MKITFISPTVNMSGGTRVMVIHAQHLMRMGHDVRIISPPPKPIPLRRQIRSLLERRGWQNPSQPVPTYFDNSRLDHQVLDRWRPVSDDDVPDGDIVIATWWETAAWVNELSPSKGSKVYFIQGHEVFPYQPIARVKATYRLPLHKIVVARWLKRTMADEYDDHDVDVVPNSVDHTQFFAPPRGKQTVPTVGFLFSTTPLKGLDTCMAALNEVRRRMSKVRMVTFGSQQPSAGALPAGAEFEYCPPQHALRNIYAQCDVWVTASRSEGFNLPAMEAMACRTPVVATRTGWPEEAITTGGNGVLVNIDDVPGLSQAVEWVLSQRDEDWKTLSKNAFSTVETSSWQASTDLFEKALVRVLGR